MIFEERNLEIRYRNGQEGHKYLWYFIRATDRLSEAVKDDLSITMFDHAKHPLDKLPHIFNPVLCVFSDGTWATMPPGHSDLHAKLYFGPRYTKLKAYGFLPLPDSKFNPGTNFKRDSFITFTNSKDAREVLVFDYYVVWKNKLKGALGLNTILASLWKKGYDTILSLGSELLKSLDSSEASLETLNSLNTRKQTSTDTSNGTTNDS